MQNINGEQVSGGVSLTWSASTFSMSYVIERRTSLGEYAPLTEVAGTSYVDNTIVPGTWYYYRIKGKNTLGAGPVSSEVHVPTYAAREEFTTPEAAPMGSLRSLSPGPGSGTVVDTTNRLSVANGYLTSIAGPPEAKFKVNSVPRQDGLAMLFKGVLRDSNDHMYLGALTEDQNPANSFYNAYLTAGGGIRVSGFDMGGPIFLYPDATLSKNIPYDVLLVFLQGRAFFYLRGGIFTSWQLMYVNHAPLTNADLSAGYKLRGAARLDAIRLTIPDLLKTFSGLAVSASAHPTNGTIIIGAADGWTDFLWTPQANEVFEIQTRGTSDDDCWITRCDQAVGTIKLIEKQHGAEIERASGEQAWAVGTEYRIACLRDGIIAQDRVRTLPQYSYDYALFNQDATRIKVNGFIVGGNLFSCALRPSGELLNIMEMM